jgi:hypothetical protein
MTYKLKTKDIIRINIELNKIQKEEVDRFWNLDKYRTNYHNFPEDNCTPVEFIDKFYDDCKICFIQALRNIVFRFINKKLDVDVFSVNQKKMIIKTGLFYVNSENFTFKEYYQILNKKTEELSNKYIKTIIMIERLPTLWVTNVLFELVKIENDKVYYFNGLINKKSKKNNEENNEDSFVENEIIN